MNLTQDEQKSLMQMIEAGVDKSAERLAKLSRTPWTLHTVSLSFMSGGRLPDGAKDAQDSYYGAFFTMPNGAFLTLFSKKSGTALARSFLGDHAGSDKVPDIEINALGEVSNIIVNAVADVMADNCGESFFISVPELAVDTKARLIARAMTKFEPAGKGFALMSYVHLSSPSLSSDCTLVILLAPKLVEAIKSSYL